MGAPLHDPVPDGRSGWRGRKVHERRPSGLGLAYDPRCETCQGLPATGALSYLHLEDAEYLVAMYNDRVLRAAAAVLPSRRWAVTPDEVGA